MRIVYVMLLQGFTSLIWASFHGHLPIVKYLLENNANIEAKIEGHKYMVNGTSILYSLYFYGDLVCLC